MGFTWVRGAVGNWSTGSTFSATLAAAPATGSCVLVGVITYNATATFPTLSNVKDSNSNAYQVTPNSPSSTNASSCGAVYMAYLLSAPSNASATVTATVSGTITYGAIWADVFTVSGGSAAFDKDVTGNGNITGTVINTPSITPANTGSLLYATAAQSTAITGVGGGWTQSGGGIDSVGSNDSEYIVSSGAPPVSVDFVCSGGGNIIWDSMAMSIALSTGFQPDEDYFFGPQWFGGSNITTVF